MRGTPEDRFFAKVEFGESTYDGTRCLLWAAATGGDGYGRFWDGERIVQAHRWLYERWVGPISAGLDLDHLCRVRACVNPCHTEPVTRAENLARSALTPQAVNAAKTHCPQGHKYTEENTYRYKASRSCRRCALNRSAAAYAAKISNREPTTNERQVTP